MQTYSEAATLAQTNAAYTAQSTAIQVSQAASGALYDDLGAQSAAAGGSGSSGGGSAADIIRNSAQQGALNRSVIQQQGLITEAGYAEQANAFTLQQQAANVAAEAQQASAAGETEAAGDYQKEADLFGELATGDFFSAALSGVAGLAEGFHGSDRRRHGGACSRGARGGGVAPRRPKSVACGSDFAMRCTMSAPCEGKVIDE